MYQVIIQYQDIVEIFDFTSIEDRNNYIVKMLSIFPDVTYKLIN